MCNNVIDMMWEPCVRCPIDCEQSLGMVAQEQIERAKKNKTSRPRSLSPVPRSKYSTDSVNRTARSLSAPVVYENFGSGGGNRGCNDFDDDNND